MVGLLNNDSLTVCHEKAVRLSAFVCENDGAMPDYPKMSFIK
jgi:sugar/nucleoside kinase (ribokinase family)